MTRTALEFVATLALLMAVLLGGQHFVERLQEPRALVSKVENGEFKELHKLVVSEQLNKFAVFAKFTNTSPGVKALNLLPFVSNVGTADIFFRWQARSLYGIAIGPDEGITWKRVPGEPGVIEIISPPLSLLETKVLLGMEDFSAVTISGSKFINEDAKKLEYLPELEKRSDEEAAAGLESENLRAVASRVVSHFVIGLVNQGASEADKVYKATVSFRSSGF